MTEPFVSLHVEHADNENYGNISNVVAAQSEVSSHALERGGICKLEVVLSDPTFEVLIEVDVQSDFDDEDTRIVKENVRKEKERRQEILELKKLLRKVGLLVKEQELLMS